MIEKNDTGPRTHPVSVSSVTGGANLVDLSYDMATNCTYERDSSEPSPQESCFCRASKARAHHLAFSRKVAAKLRVRQPTSRAALACKLLAALLLVYSSSKINGSTKVYER